jgi:hypothetical protein
MIQLTHLGRRTGWNTGDWLPVLAASPIREPAHRAFPKQAEDWETWRVSSESTPMRPRACRRQEWTASSSRPTATSWTASGRRRRIGATTNTTALSTIDCASLCACSAQSVLRWVQNSSSAYAWWPMKTGRTGSLARKALRSRDGWWPVGVWIFSTLFAVTSKPTRRCRRSSRPREWFQPRTWISPARYAMRHNSRFFTPPASATWRRRAMPSPKASSTWSA